MFKLNTEFLVYSYFISLFVDWIFQLDWQAKNKSKWNSTDNKIISLLALISHSLIYTSITWFLLQIIGVLHGSNIVYLILFISHVIIDTRIPVKWIMKFKGMSNDQINDLQNFGFMHIGIDHRLHEIVLVVLSLFV